MWEENESGQGANHHPTVKSTKLMAYLCKLVTPEGGIILDPFAGSGSTGVAAVEAGFQFVGIERDDSYAVIAETRLASAVERAADARVQHGMFDRLCDDED